MPRKQTKRPRARKRSNVVETSSDSESEEFIDQLQGNEEALWDFLYGLKRIEEEDEDEERAVDNFEAYFEMFNAPFVLGDVVDQCRDYLTKEHTSFEMLVANERVEVEGVHFVHVQSVGDKNSSARRAINRITSFLPEGDSIMLSACPYHAKGDCKLVEENVAFMCYLQSFGIQENGLTLQEDMEVKREHGEKQVNDAAIFKNDLSIQGLPSLHINGKKYVFLHDIRMLLDLTEDYALAILAQCKVQDPILGCLQTTCGPQQELLLCYDEARHEKNLPTEEKFREVQASVPYSRLLSEEPSDEDIKGTMHKKRSKLLSERGSNPAAYIVEEPNNKKVSKGVKQLIDPWMDESWIYDNNFQLALDMDKFFGRGGKRERKKWRLLRGMCKIQ